MKEWRDDVKEVEPTHRHLSPLLGVHPFAIINEEDTPDLFKAAKKRLEARLEGRDGMSGWTGAHAAIMSAWFQDANTAYMGVADILSVRTNRTFLNAERIFQIDENLGVCSLIAEMLIQSHRKDKNGNFIIDLLPAIPDDWAKGSAKGLCARGGFELDMAWEEGQIISATISSEKGGTCSVRFKERIISLTLKPGEEKSLSGL